jgi:hypothetical protein
MGEGSAPIFDRAIPFFSNIVHRQIHQFENSSFIRKHSLRLNHLTQRPIERFNGVGSVNHPTNFHGIIKDGNDILPMANPNLTDRRVQRIPLSSKGIQRGF